MRGPAVSDIVEQLRDSVTQCRAVDRSALLAAAADEIERLRLALRRLADQNATFSIIGGNLIVDVEPALTTAEREAIGVAAKWCEEPMDPIHSKTSLDAMLAADTLRGLLERTKASS